jgi:hypothetical protein
MLLLITVTAALPGTHAFTFSTVQPIHHAGCHSSAPEIPTPAPVSYQCCSSGHNWALLSASFSPHPPIALFLFPDRTDDLFVNPSGDAHPQVVAFPFGSPPNIAPLRI